MDTHPLHLLDLTHQLDALHLHPGDTLVVEAPKLDQEMLDGGAAELTRSLLEAITPQGTLVVPTCTSSEGYPRASFDPLLSPSEMGPFSEFFRQQPDVVRSHSPTHSVAALGPSADAICAGHRTASGRLTRWGENAFGHGSPWDVLHARDALWIMLDGDWAATPFTIYVQALYAENRSGITKSPPAARFDGQALCDLLEQTGVAHRLNVDGHEVLAWRMQPAIAAALKALSVNPQGLRPDGEFRAWLHQAASIQQSGYVQAAAARAVITPALPCLRWDGKPLTGIAGNLYARVLVLAGGSAPVALISCDLLGIQRGHTERIRREVCRQAGLAASRVFVACTHAHSTPDTVGAGNEDAAYIDAVIASIARAVSEAVAHLEPARLGWARVPVRGLAQSRRVRMTDGKVYTTRYGVPSTWRVNPDLIAGYGRIDPDLTLIRIESLAGEVLGAVANFGCHPSVALCSPNISGDYAGEATYILEQALGGGAVVLFFNGSAGDVDPTLEMPYWGPRDDANARRLGRIFAGQVLEGLERVQVLEQALVDTASVEVDLPLRADWIEMLERQRSRLRQEFVGLNQFSPVINELLRERMIHTEVQVIRLGDLCVCGLPGEVLTATGLRLKQQATAGQVAVVELANDYLGYIPTLDAWQEGGYEIGLHMWTRVEANAEDLLLSATAAAIGRLWVVKTPAEPGPQTQPQPERECDLLAAGDGRSPVTG